MLLFFRRCTIISELHFDFERVLKLQQLLYFHPRTHAHCKSSETIDDMKLDYSSDTNSSSENTYISSEENYDNVKFYRWQIVEKKITKSKVDVTLKEAAEMFKDEIKTLKEHIYIKRRQLKAYNEIKASLSENDLLLHVDFAKSYKNDQQDTIQSAYYGNQCFRIFTACFYAKSPNNNDVRNDIVVVITGSSDHDRVACMICLQKVVHEIEHMHEKKKTYARMFTLGVMEWGHNLDLTIYSNY